MKAVLFFLLAAIAGPAAAKPIDCSAAFAIQMDPRLTLHDVTFMLDPHHFERKYTFLEVRSFDADDYPIRNHMMAVALVGAGPLDNGIEPVGGFILSKYEAYFDEEGSKLLNKKNGRLNAIFVAPGSHGECSGVKYIVSFDDHGVFYVNGKRVVKSKDLN